MLALGVAVALARALGDRPAAATRWVRRATPAVATLLLLLTAWGMWQLPRVRERRAAAGLPAARPGATNVLLIILDKVRAANLSLYGYERETTPNLDEWAASGFVFDRAVSPSPWTLPTHASMFTGRAPPGVPGRAAGVEGPLHYIRNGDGSEELYDVAADTSAEHDLAETEAVAVRRLRAALDSTLRRRK